MRKTRALSDLLLKREGGGSVTDLRRPRKLADAIDVRWRETRKASSQSSRLSISAISSRRTVRMPQTRFHIDHPDDAPYYRASVLHQQLNWYRHLLVDRSSLVCCGRQGRHMHARKLTSPVARIARSTAVGPSDENLRGLFNMAEVVITP